MNRPGPGVYGARRRGASTPVTRLAEANRLDVAQDELAILIAPAEVRDDAVARLLRLLTEISPSRRATDEVLEGAADLVYDGNVRLPERVAQLRALVYDVITIYM